MKEPAITSENGGLTALVSLRTNARGKRFCRGFRTALRFEGIGACDRKIVPSVMSGVGENKICIRVLTRAIQAEQARYRGGSQLWRLRTMVNFLLK